MDVEFNKEYGHFKNILLEYPTGYGKSKIALDICKARGWTNVLIVIPRVVLIDNWMKEIQRWESGIIPEFVTYVSLHKVNKVYDCIIFDEAQHISERCQNVIFAWYKSNALRHCVLLSAKINRDLKYNLRSIFGDMTFKHIDTRTAIDCNRLPDPRVYLLQMELDDNERKFIFLKNKKGSTIVRVPFEDRNKYIKDAKKEVECTAKEYYELLNEEVDKYKKLHISNGDAYLKNIWLNKAGLRLKWLSEQKTDITNKILHHLKDYRTLTFCSSIKQTEALDGHCVNSKNNLSEIHLIHFNEGKLNHITSVDMLNEGVNLVDCQVGLYASLHSSERLIIQQLGRLLRHKEPVIIIPYFKDTRDEEIVNKMLEQYNPELVSETKEIDKIII